MIDALRHRFGERVRIDGADAGLHVVAWFCDLAQQSEAALIEAARSKVYVGVYLFSALFDRRSRSARARPEVVGVVMGFAALEARQIESRGCRLLAEAVNEVVARRSRKLDQ